MTHTPKIMSLPIDTLDRTTVRFRLQEDDYMVANELTMGRSTWEALGSPSRLYLTLSGEVPQLAPDQMMDAIDPETGYATTGPEANFIGHERRRLGIDTDAAIRDGEDEGA